MLVSDSGRQEWTVSAHTQVGFIQTQLGIDKGFVQRLLRRYRNRNVSEKRFSARGAGRTHGASAGWETGWGTGLRGTRCPAPRGAAPAAGGRPPARTPAATGAMLVSLRGVRELRGCAAAAAAAERGVEHDRLPFNCLFTWWTNTSFFFYSTRQNYRPTRAPAAGGLCETPAHVRAK